MPPTISSNEKITVFILLLFFIVYGKIVTADNKLTTPNKNVLLIFLGPPNHIHIMLLNFGDTKSYK